jgi:hypothetical protein
VTRSFRKLTGTEFRRRFKAECGRSPDQLPLGAVSDRDTTLTDAIARAIAEHQARHPELSHRDIIEALEASAAAYRLATERSA